MNTLSLGLFGMAWVIAMARTPGALIFSIVLVILALLIEGYRSKRRRSAPERPVEHTADCDQGDASYRAHRYWNAEYERNKARRTQQR